jgi:PTS system nitrogen regulatory IIA component
MLIADTISPACIVCGAEARSKKRALEQLSSLLASGGTGLVELDVFESLLARERLGSTGIGHGVAIPHGRFKATKRAIGAFMQLRKGVDFSAIDNEPVDLIFALLVPEESTEEHLQLLAMLAEMFSSESLRAELRRAKSTAEIHRLLTRQGLSAVPQATSGRA